MSNTIVIIRNAAKTDFGGGEKVPVFIAKEVMATGELHPIIFSRSQKLLEFAIKESVDCKKTWWWQKQNWNGKNVFLTPVYIVWQLILFIYYFVLFMKHKPSVVHLQSKDDFIAGTFAARTLKIRVLWSDYADLKHIFMNHAVWYKNPVGKMVYFAGKFAEKIIVVSQQDKSLIAAHIPDGTVKNRMQVIYNGAFDSYKAVEKNPAFTFVSSSRIVADKGIGELIKAFNRLHSVHSDIKLHIVGDGPEKDFFEDSARSNSAIMFFGHKSNPLDYVNKAHVFIIPTHHEGFSLALVEACMLAMPIIATDVGGNPEIIRNKETGLLVPPRNANDLYMAMEELYTNTKLREMIAANARMEYINKFNFATIIQQQFIPLYKGKE